MKVEHLAEGVTCILGDCREVLPTLGSVDAVVTDPPYGIGESSDSIKSRQRRPGGNSRALADQRDYGSFAWDAEPISSDTVQLIQSVSKWQIIFGGNYFQLGPTPCWLVWDKQNGTNDFADCELAWTNLPGAVRRVYWRWNGMIRRGDDVREHPTQKPEGVMRWCIEKLPADAFHVCDPFMGSGTTGVAAVGLGKRFTGIEIDERYFAIACRRIEQAMRQPDLLVSAPPPAKQEALL